MKDIVGLSEAPLNEDLYQILTEKSYDLDTDDGESYASSSCDDDSSNCSYESCSDLDDDELEAVLMNLSLVVDTVPTPDLRPLTTRKSIEEINKAHQNFGKLMSKNNRSSLNSQVVNSVDSRSPQGYLDAFLEKRSMKSSFYETADDSFLAITAEHLQDYPLVSSAARNEDLEQLRKIHKAQTCLQSCNEYGESIVHIVCRRGSSRLLAFLIEEANISLRVRDDVGRTPLHDAAWTETPNFELIRMILSNCPDFLFAKDKRGHSALAYVPRKLWGEWRIFLDSAQDLIQNAIDSQYVTRTEC